MAQDNSQTNSKGPSKIRHLKFGSSNSTSTESYFEDPIPKSDTPIYSVETSLPKDESYYDSRRSENNSPSTTLVTKNISLKVEEDVEDLGKKSTRHFTSSGEQAVKDNSRPGMKVLLDKSFSFPKKDPNKVSGNSLSSIFYKDHQEISGIRRVFQKSILFLILNLAAFGLLNFIGINLFYLSESLPISLAWGIGAMVVAVTITNLFYIVLADRSYFWLNLVGQIIILIAIQGFVGRGLEPLTLIVLAVVTLMSYLAYSELEKAQLGSRLFSIPNIIAESSRILSWVAILIICLGTFNQIVARGTDSSGKFVNGERFFVDIFLSKDVIVDTFLIGSATGRSSVGANNFLMARGLTYQNGGLSKTVEGNVTTATFRDFLNINYKPSETLISNTELEDIQLKCVKDKVQNCDTEVQKFKDTRLDSWRVEGYKDVPLTLDSKLDLNNYRILTRQYYVNIIRDITSPKESSISSLPSLPNIPIISDFPSGLILPGFFVFILAILLTLVRFIIHGFITALTWIIWNSLKLLGFVRIEIENVEAEVVSI